MAKYILLDNSQVLGNFRHKGDVVNVPDNTIPALTWEPLDDAGREAVILREKGRAEKEAVANEKKLADTQKHAEEKEKLQKELELLRAQKDSLEGKLRRFEVIDNAGALPKTSGTTKSRGVSGAVRGTDVDAPSTGGEAEVSGEVTE